jgi:N-methylhydantoinase A
VYFPAAPDGDATPIYDRNRLPIGAPVPGPAIVEEDYSTVVVPPTHVLTRLPTGDLIIEDNPQQGA